MRTSKSENRSNQRETITSNILEPGVSTESGTSTAGPADCRTTADTFDCRPAAVESIVEPNLEQERIETCENITAIRNVIADMKGYLTTELNHHLKH